jgi:hypothetical protein
MFPTGYIYYWLPLSAIEITGCPSTKRDREKGKDLRVNNLLILCHLLIM